MNSEISQIDSLERFTSDTSMGASIRDHTTPYPSAAERIRDKISMMRNSVRGVSGKIGDMSIKAYLLTTIVIVSGGAGLVYDRLMNPNYQRVPPTTAILETATAIGGQVGRVALREIQQMDARQNSDANFQDVSPYAAARSAADFFNHISGGMRDLQDSSIAYTLKTYGLTYDVEKGWMETGVSTPEAEFFPTPEGLASLIESAASHMRVMPGDPEVLNAVATTLDQVIEMRPLCESSADCPPIAHPIDTGDGLGMIAIYQGEGRAFKSFNEGVDFLDNSGWTEPYDAPDNVDPYPVKSP